MLMYILPLYISPSLVFQSKYCRQHRFSPHYVIAMLWTVCSSHISTTIDKATTTITNGTTINSVHWFLNIFTSINYYSKQKQYHDREP
jgi:hypothetical protein